MPQETFLEKQEESLSVHIFSVSAALVGVCLTVISLFSISDALKRLQNIGDELIAFDAILFLVTCVFSYMAIRTRDRKRRLILEKTADGLFLAALFIIVWVAVLIAWEYLP